MSAKDEALAPRRLEELAERAGASGQACFSPFLTPAEAELARQAARKAGVALTLFGGYPEAERQMGGFGPEPLPGEAFPLGALALRWPRQTAPTHRDLLGSVMGLGLQRQWLGDIVLEKDWAALFATRAMARHIADHLGQAGKVSLQVELLKELPVMAAPEGAPFRDTVPSLRLDALVASGLGLSRAKAAALIEAGQVKLRHVQALRPDARVQEGDMISVRGMGRVQLSQVGKPTRKDRLPVLLLRFGIGPSPE